MASSNQLELVVTVEVDKANRSIKSVNANLSDIEAAATKSAHAASQGIDGMTASMVKGATAGNLLADAIQKAIEFAKEWTIEAAKEAAQVARMESATYALAKAHGIGADAVRDAVEAVQQLGFENEDALRTINRLIVADLDLSKAKGLAKVAKDAAALEVNLGAAEALEKIIQAIEFGNSRALRSVGLLVDFDKELQIAELRLGRTLSDNEKIQLRYQAVMRQAPRIQGAGAAAAAEAGAQMKALAREVKDLREAVGARFQDEFKTVIGHLRSMVSWLKENVDLLAKFGTMAIWLAGVLVTYGIATKILGIAGAVEKLTAALAANPWALLLTGIVAAGAVVYKTYREMQQDLEKRGQAMENAALRQQLLSGRISLADLRKRGMTDDQIRELVSGRKLEPGETVGFDTGVKVELANELEALKLAQEIRKRQTENEKYFRERAIAAGAAGKTGFAKDLAEINAEIAKRTTFVDERGVSHYVALTKAAWNAIIDEAQKKLQAFKDHFAMENRKALAEHLEAEEEAARKMLEWDAHRYQQRIQNDAEIAERNLDHVRQVYAFEERRAGFERDVRLRQLDGVDAQTLQQKLAVEQQKAAIEIEYLEKVHEVKQRLYDLDTSRMLLEEELNLRRLGYRADEIKARITELSQQREDIREQADEANDEAIKAARENAANRAAQLVRDHNRQIFDSLKQQAGGVFDALLTKSQSVWSAIGNSLKTALLTAIKDVVTSRVAAMLMQLMGMSVTLAGGGTGGGWGRLAGALGLGAVPVFGGAGALGPGGTPPFVPSGSGGYGGGAVSGAGFAGLLTNLKSFLGIGGSIQTGEGAATTWQAATLGQRLSSIGRSNAALLGGGLLGLDAWRRGGAAGMGEMTAAGALIGFKYSGGFGAAIGAGVGAIVGGLRWLFGGKSPEERMRDAVKKVWQVDIQDKGVLSQLAQMAQAQFGGNYELAARSPQVRELVQIYAQMTGQRMPLVDVVRPVSLFQSAGGLYQNPTFVNGTGYAFESVAPAFGNLNLDRLPAGTAATGTPVTFTIQLDGEATTSLLEGRAVEAIAKNGRLIVQSAQSATRANYGRRQTAVHLLDPGLLATS